MGNSPTISKWLIWDLPKGNNLMILRDWYEVFLKAIALKGFLRGLPKRNSFMISKGLIWGLLKGNRPTISKWLVWGLFKGNRPTIFKGLIWGLPKGNSLIVSKGLIWGLPKGNSLMILISLTRKTFLKLWTWLLEKDSLKSTCIPLKWLKKYKLKMDQKSLSPIVSVKETNSPYLV